MSLNNKQSLAFEEIKKGGNVYVSGAGGVGKSYLIEHVKSFYEKDNDTIFCGPTGVSAMNIKGATLHSTFGLPTHILREHDAKSCASKSKVAGLLKAVNRIVIDEVSMIRADVFITIDNILRLVKRRDEPFGGVQVIVFGDMFQLSPVLVPRDREHYNRYYDTVFCFDTQTWAEAGFITIELDEVIRQTDSELISHLHNIRVGNDKVFESVSYFVNNSADAGELIQTDPIILCTTNAIADEQNQIRYEELEAEEHVFYADINGKYADPPVEAVLKLKEGMRVMFTVNDPDKQYVNGSMGYILEISKDMITVVIDPDDVIVYVSRYKFEQYSYEADKEGHIFPTVTASFTQYPIKAGWAVTIHKSQGKTLDRAIIDFGRGCFLSGQAYVALSRVKTIDGIGFLRGFSFSDVITDKRVQNFYSDNCRGGLSLF